MRRQEAPRPGACDFAEDPTLDAREAEPVWLPDPDALIGVGEAVRDDTDRFSLWSLPGRKSIVHDGRRLLVRSRLGRRVVRLALSLGVGDTTPFAFAMPPRGVYPTEGDLAAIGGALTGRNGALPSSTPLTRSHMVHMRALLALDAEAGGASEREIAMIVFGETDRTPAWNGSALRANVRYLLRHGRAFRDGRYRELLRSIG